MLGAYGPGGKLVSACSVGTRSDTAEAAELKRQLKKLSILKSPFAAGVAKPGGWSKRSASSERWVQPKLVAEVEFAEWTPDGQVRHASYVSLRTDEPATAIVREKPKDLEAEKPAAKKQASAIKVSNADRVIDPSTA